MGHVNSNSQRTTVMRKLFHLLPPIVTFVSQVLLFVSQFICGEVSESYNGNKLFELIVPENLAIPVILESNFTIMQQTKSTEMMVSDEKSVTFGRQGPSRERIITIMILAVATIIFIVGIALIAIAAKEKGKDDGTSDKSAKCDYSEEAKRVGLGEFLDKVKSSYYKLHPYVVYDDPDVTPERIKKEYVAYDPTPSLIKIRTDTSLNLLKEINKKDINKAALKPREKKVVAQVKHYLQHVFGQPFDVNYYAGDWMMGPNKRCWQEICNIGRAVQNGLGRYFKPNDASDVELIETKLRTFNAGILQYIENMKMGIRKGMVRSKEACEVGFKALRSKYMKVYLNNETGVLQESFVQPLLNPNFYSGITTETDSEWQKGHNGKNVSDSVKGYLVDYLGKPLVHLLRYIKDEHIRHCVPGNVSSGWATLPLKHVWLDGKENKSWSTNQYLSDDKQLNGSLAYTTILSYFTTNDMTPMEVTELGKKLLNLYYPMVLEVAREVTGEANNDTAKQEFKKLLNDTSKFAFNTKPIPKNESDEEAERKCSDIKGAKEHCPTRWAAVQAWMDEIRKVMSLLTPKTVPMFHFTGDKATTPTCPIDVQPNFDPAMTFQSYHSSDSNCTKSATFKIPFFSLFPTYEEWSVDAHEAMPGHHLQVQGHLEHFLDSCGGAIAWLDGRTSYTAFKEGWALYAEYPLIGRDTDMYVDEPMQKYGMLKWLVWRSIRLIVDPGLNYFGMKRDEVLDYFKNYTWAESPFVLSEAVRYESIPGQATSYMVGQGIILEARQYAEKELGDKFDLRDFHYQILSQGSSPLGYLTDHVKEYVACVKNQAREGCDVIMNPPKKS